MIINKPPISFNIDPTTGNKDNYPFWDYVNNNVWEPHTFEILNKFCSKNTTYVDIGAWIGPTVLYASKLSNKVISFEPDHHAFSALQKNLALNPDILNVEAYPVAINNTNGKVTFGTNTELGDSMSSLLFSKISSWTVDSFTLEYAFTKYNIKDCNFIKIDIEGGEHLVLPQAKSFIKSFKPTLYLSLHTCFVPNKRLFLENVKDFSSIYKNIYDCHGKKLSLKDIDTLPQLTEIVLTDLSW